jgi:hypothetical protein
LPHLNSSATLFSSEEDDDEEEANEEEDEDDGAAGATAGPAGAAELPAAESAGTAAGPADALTAAAAAAGPDAAAGSRLLVPVPGSALTRMGCHMAREVERALRAGSRMMQRQQRSSPKHEADPPLLLLFPPARLLSFPFLSFPFLSFPFLSFLGCSSNPTQELSRGSHSEQEDASNGATEAQQARQISSDPCGSTHVRLLRRWRRVSGLCQLLLLWRAA